MNSGFKNYTKEIYNIDSLDTTVENEMENVFTEVQEPDGLYVHKGFAEDYTAESTLILMAGAVAFASYGVKKLKDLYKEAQ